MLCRFDGNISSKFRVIGIKNDRPQCRQRKSAGQKGITKSGSGRIDDRNIIGDLAASTNGGIAPWDLLVQAGLTCLSGGMEVI
jgi:hypothetical protein